MARFFIYDELNPQDCAMLQALYSRSPQSVQDHIQKVKETGSGKFMEKFYVGYGHSSIADCGSTTIFIEGISILADKAVQDWPLYAGQETSTRYVDMSKQPIIDPLGTTESKVILDNWMSFYLGSQEAVRDHLRRNYPKQSNEDEAVYQKAITARSFDIVRGFLPAGITTQLSWHTNLRQAWDKLCWLRHHPLKEVQKAAEKILEKLKEKYSHSFSHEFIDEHEDYRHEVMRKYHYYSSDKLVSDFSFSTSIQSSDLDIYSDIVSSRPEKSGLPHFLSELGIITFDFLLDFGSFRDIQRHRNGVCRMPLLTTDIGFNAWYLEQLPEGIRREAEKLIKEQKKAIQHLDTTLENKQYYIALGFNVPCRVTYGLPATVYVVELRSGRSVHPTLRQVAHKMHRALTEKFPILALNSDLDPSDWDVRRGLQDIIEKKEAAKNYGKE